MDGGYYGNGFLQKKKRQEMQEAAEEKKSLGGKIRTIRAIYRLTQKEFAEILQVSHAHISKIESHKDSPSNSLLTVIISKFNIREEWLNNSLDVERDIDMHVFEDLSCFVSNLKYLQKKLGLSKREMDDLFSISNYHLDNNEYLKLNGLQSYHLHKVCEYFKIPPYEIINTQLSSSLPEDSQKSLQFSKDEQLILGIYKDCSERDKKLILEIIKKFG